MISKEPKLISRFLLLCVVVLISACGSKEPAFDVGYFGNFYGTCDYEAMKFDIANGEIISYIIHRHEDGEGKKYHTYQREVMELLRNSHNRYESDMGGENNKYIFEISKGLEGRFVKEITGSWQVPFKECKASEIENLVALVKKNLGSIETSRTVELTDPIYKDILVYEGMLTKQNPITLSIESSVPNCVTLHLKSEHELSQGSAVKIIRTDYEYGATSLGVMAGGASTVFTPNKGKISFKTSVLTDDQVKVKITRLNKEC